jgi:Zn-dependent metalloprotease
MAKRKTTPKGLQHFSFHAAGSKGAELLDHLRNSFTRMVAPAGAQEDPLAALDPESAARIHLDRLLASDQVKGLSVSDVEGRTVEFKPIGTQAVPFTGTTIVKFRQFVDIVPVFGSFIAIELDPGNKNQLVAVDSAITQLKDLPSAIAKTSPAEAVTLVLTEGEVKRGSPVERPRLFYYFDDKRGNWLLAYIVEDAPAPKEQRTGTKRRKSASPLIRRADYVINAQSGKLIQAVPRNFGAAASGEFQDELGNSRTIRYDQASSPKRARLADDLKKVATFDCKFKDVDADPSPLPGSVVTDGHAPPVWSSGAVSAHANAVVVADFLRQILQRDSFDDRGAELISSINCVSSEEPIAGDPTGWMNAFWNGNQMAYGQVAIQSGGHRSLAAAQDIVGHEIFHAVTERTSDLVYQSQSGALNESYSDIFGVLINNWAAGKWTDAKRATNWEWLIGGNLTPEGTPFRSMSDPSDDPRLAPGDRQPKFFKDFRVLPVNRRNDMGGVHINSGIPNYCAYLILTSVDAAGRQHFTADECAQLFYITVTARLNRTANFAANRASLINSAQSLFRNDADGGTARVGAVTKACDTVGI